MPRDRFSRLCDGDSRLLEKGIGECDDRGTAPHRVDEELCNTHNADDALELTQLNRLEERVAGANEIGMGTALDTEDDRRGIRHEGVGPKPSNCS